MNLVPVQPMQLLCIISSGCRLLIGASVMRTCTAYVHYYCNVYIIDAV